MNSENDSLADQVIELEAERNAREAREAELHIRIRADSRAAGGDRRELKALAQMLDQARDRRGELRRARGQAAVRPRAHGRNLCAGTRHRPRELCWPTKTIAALHGEQLAIEDTGLSRDA